MNANTSAKAPDLPIGAYLGWDWADEKHDLCLRLPGEKSGSHTVIKNTPEVIHGYLQKLHQQFPEKRIVLSIEAARSALAPIFEEYASWLVLYEINPMAMSKYRQALHPSGVKSDAIDCALLADIVISHPEQLHVHIPLDAQSLEIRTFSEDRRKLVDRRTALANELKSQLKGYYPQALGFIGDDTTQPFAPAFLLKWPSLEALQRAKPQAIRKFCLAHQRRLTEGLKKCLDALPGAQAPSQRPCRVEPAACYVQALARELQSLHASIRSYDQMLAARVAEHPACRLLAELPGAGPVLRARLLAVLGQPAALQGCGPAPYKNADDLAVITGIAPVQRGSGKTQVTLCRAAFSLFPHQTFMEYAKQSVLFCPWARAFVEHKTGQGWKYWRIIRALAFKWIRILVAVMRSGVAYDENKYVKHLLEKHCPYMTAQSSPTPSK